MAQIDDLRKQQANHEQRISKLEALINPAESQNFLDDAPAPSDPPQTADAPVMTVTVTGETLPPAPIITGDTNSEGGMGIVVGENGQQPSVSEEGANEEDPKE